MKTIKLIFITFLLSIMLSCNTLPKNPPPSSIGSNFPLRKASTFSVDKDIQKIAVSGTWIAIYTPGELINVDISGWAVNYAPGKITAVDILSQKTLWSIDLAVLIDSLQEFQIIDDKLVFVSTTNQIFMINKDGQQSELNLSRNGKRIMRIVPSSPNYLYVFRGSDRLLEAYDISKNMLLWQAAVKRRSMDVFYDPSQNIAYLTTDAYIRALDNTTGKSLWKQDRSSTYNAFDNGILYLSERVNSLIGFRYADTLRLSAFDTESRQELWSTDVASVEEFYKLTIIDNLLLVSGSGGLIAVEKSNGNHIWRTQVGEEFRTRPIKLDNVIYVKGSNLDLYAISPDDGSILGLVNASSSMQPTYEEGLGSMYLLKDEIVFNTRNAIVVYKVK